MLKGITIEVECDECGRLFRVDTSDGGWVVPTGWTLFDVAMDVTRWNGSGHVCSDGSWYCDACDNAAGGNPQGLDDPTADAEPPAVPPAEPVASVALPESAVEALAALDYVVAWAADTREYWDRDADAKVGKRLIALAGGLPGYDAQMDRIHALRQRLREPIPPQSVPDSITDVAKERARQINGEGCSAIHDDRWDAGELATAGGLYALDARNASSQVPTTWPWDEEWWKPTDDRRRNLVKAAALMIAEIDRLDRAEQRNAEPGARP